MSFEFLEDDKTNTRLHIRVPYFEDARANFAPYYASAAAAKPEKRKRLLVDSQDAVGAELAKLGGVVTRIRAILAKENSQRRYGFLIEFEYRGVPGVLHVVGLPMKSAETPLKVLGVQVQALLNVRDWLKAAVTNQVFAPGGDVLIPYLLVDGERTFAQYVRDMKQLPPAPAIQKLDIVIEKG